MIGVWTGCGFDTIPVIFPPPDILGYDACVESIVSNPSQPSEFVDDSEIPIVIV